MSRTFMCLILCLCLGLVFQCPAQMSGGAKTVIDGAVTPQNIPDETAWLMLFTTIADGPNAPTYNVRTGFLAAGNFDKAAVADIMAAANEAMARIHAMESQIMASALSGDAKTQALLSQRDAIIRDVVAGLMQRASIANATKIRAHITDHVKPGVRIVR